MADTACGKRVNTAAMFPQSSGYGCLETKAEIVEPLCGAVQKRSNAGFGAINAQRCNTLLRLQHAKAHGAVEPLRLRCDVVGDIVLRGGDEFSGGGGSRGAQVGDKVGNGEVGFVANGGDHRQHRCGNGARNLLGVERGKVFERSAAARKNNEIDHAGFVQVGDCAFDFRRG